MAKINIGDTWKDVSAIKLNIADTWKSAAKGWINVGDTWKLWYSTEQLLLDTYPGAIAAFSVRKLSSTYTGPCLRVRRSNDNATMDINFVDNFIDTASLAAFCTTNNGYVNIWYNQTGSNNLVNSTNSTQPWIYVGASSSIYGSTNFPGLSFQSSTTGMLTENTFSSQSNGYWTAFAFVQPFPAWILYGGTASLGSIIDGDTGNAGVRLGQYIRVDGSLLPQTVAFNGSTTFVDSTATSCVPYTGTYVLSAAKYPGFLEVQSNLNTNGATVMNPLNNSTANVKLAIGAYAGDINVQKFQGTIQTAILYPIDRNSNVSAISSELMLYSNVTKFLQATSITDTTISNALTELVKDLYKASIWDKIKAIYPLVGGTSDTHKYNLKDPRDLDAAYRITWNGTITHNSNGITGSTNGEGNTHMNPSVMAVNNTSFGFYNRTNSYHDGIDMGVLAATRMGTWSKHSNGYMMSDHYIDTQRVQYNLATAANTGLIISNRTKSSVLNLWQNGIKRATKTVANVTSIPNGNMCLLSQNGSAFSNRNLAFAYIGFGLTDAEVDALNTAVVKFQTSLGRNV